MTTPVFIVYAPTADKMGPDLERMNRVEEMPADLARMWIADGSGRKLTDDELAAYQQQRDAQAKAQTEDLTSLKKADLEQLAADRGVDISTAKTKADIVTALQDANSDTAAEPAGDVNPDSAATGQHTAQPMVVTDENGNDVSGSPEPGGAE